MKTIQIVYWHSTNLGLDYKHLQTFEYSVNKRNEIINTILNNNLSVMLRPFDDNLMIAIDNGRFSQR